VTVAPIDIYGKFGGLRPNCLQGPTANERVRRAILARKHGISEPTFYAWKSKFGGMSVPDARRLKQLEEENARLKKLLAEAMLDNAVLKDITARKW
jgi:putative transposase